MITKKIIFVMIVSVAALSACQQESINDSVISSNANLIEGTIKESERDDNSKQGSDKESSIENSTRNYNQSQVSQIKKHIQELIKNGNRKWGTENELTAANYLKDEMDSYGYVTYIQEFPAYEFDIRASGNVEYFNLNPYNSEVIGIGHNVIADLNTSKETDQILVLSAHYDTVSEEPGIIDNTSGVVTLLEVAHMVSNLSLPFDLRFIFFSSEERYLYGSKYYVSNLTENDLNHIAACINVDMVGYKDGEELVLATPYFAHDTSVVRNSLNGLDNTLTKEWHRIFPELETYVKVETASDHFSFEKKGIPNMMITQKEFDIETVRKKDSDLDNLSISELEYTINLIKKYIQNIDITKIAYE